MHETTIAQQREEFLREREEFMKQNPIWREFWQIKKTKFDDGQMEIVASRQWQYLGNLKTPVSARKKKGESDSMEENRRKAAVAAKKSVRQKCKAMQADRLLTLTYRENMVDRERLKRDFDRFRRRMSKYRQWRYIATTEPQDRGAWHIHVACRGRLQYQVIRAIWLDIVGGKGMGNVDVRNPRTGGQWQQHKLAAYLSKYITKNAEQFDLNEKRYWCSRGIDVPEPQYRMGYGGWEMADIMAECLREAAADGYPANLQAYSDGYGTFYLATPPVPVDG